MKEFKFDGSIYQNGQQHGTLIVERYDSVMNALFGSEFWRLTKKRFPFSIPALIRNLRLISFLKKEIKRTPLADSYIKGLLSGKGMTKIKLYTILLNEILAGDRTGVVEGFGCSSLIIRLNGGIAVGKNFDFQYPLVPHQGLIVRKQKKYLAFASFSPLLMPLGGQLGMNEQGVVVSYNYSYSIKGIYFKGIPGSFVVHEILSKCKSSAEAMKLLQDNKYRVNNGCSLGIADGETGFIAELYGPYLDILQNGHRLALAHTNHFQTAQLRQFNFPDSAVFKIKHPSFLGKRSNESSITRLTKLQEKIEKIEKVSDIKNILSEQSDADGLNNIFQTTTFWGTISSFIALPRESKVICYNDIRKEKGVTIDMKELLK